MRFDRPPAGFQADMDALPDDSTRRMALLLAQSIRDGKVHGVPLERRASTGDLSDCFKVYFDPRGGTKPRFRLVYRLRSSELQVVPVQPVAVGRREGLDAYLRAAQNLGRSPTAD
ncbi:hypothetical protein [uncultured Amnibacterium sp.]|uniref:hypothetical protein n=1 Tax=uncultured Amnibacterium sp. TaxID=1631851 RepID=UPI0035CBAF40